MAKLSVIQKLVYSYNDEIIIGNIYIEAPVVRLKTMNNYVNLYIIFLTNTHTILVVDFNFSDIHWDSWTAMHNNPSSLNFLNTLQDNFLLQYVDIPTRGRGLDVPRILDLVISKTEIVTSLEYLAPLGKSDHTVITVNTNLKEDKGAFVPRQNYNKGQYEELEAISSLRLGLSFFVT